MNPVSRKTPLHRVQCKYLHLKKYHPSVGYTYNKTRYFSLLHKLLQSNTMPPSDQKPQDQMTCGSSSSSVELEDLMTLHKSIIGYIVAFSGGLTLQNLYLCQ